MFAAVRIMITLCAWVRQPSWTALDGQCKGLPLRLASQHFLLIFPTTANAVPLEAMSSSAEKAPARVFPDLVPLLALPLCACGNLGWLLALAEFRFPPRVKWGKKVHTHLKGLSWVIGATVCHGLTVSVYYMWTL